MAQPRYPAHFKSAVEIKCLCGGTAYAGYDEEGGAVIHSQPACQKFLDLEPDAFLRWLRIELQRPA